MRILISTLAILALAVPARSAEEAPSAVIKVGTAVSKMEIEGEAKAFTIPANTKLWAWTRVTGAGDSIRVVFARGGKAVFTQDLKVPHSPYRTNACRTFRTGDSGEWTVEVRDAAGKVLGSAAFAVEVK